MASKVHENSAPPALDARAIIIAEHDDHIIEVIITPKTFGARWIGVLDQPIVVAVSDGIAPSVKLADRSRWQACRRRAAPIRSIEHLAYTPSADGCGPVALALANLDTRSPQGATPGAPTDAHNPVASQFYCLANDS